MNLSFEDFDVIPHVTYYSNCTSDHVEISYEDFSQKFCGYSNPGPFKINSTTMTVKFHTDGGGTSTGFLAVLCCSVTVTTNATGEFYQLTPLSNIIHLHG